MANNDVNLSDIVVNSNDGKSSKFTLQQSDFLDPEMVHFGARALSLVYQTQLLLLLLASIFIILLLCGGLYYLLVWQFHMTILPLIAFLILYILVYLCLITAVVKILRLRFKSPATITTRTRTRTRTHTRSRRSILRVFQHARHSDSDHSHSHSHSQSQHDAELALQDLYHRNHVFIRRTMLCFCVMRIVLLLVSCALLLYWQMYSNHLPKLLGYELVLVLLVWFDWNSFFDGIMHGSDERKIGVYFNQTRVTKYYALLVGVVAMGESIQNVCLFYEQIASEYADFYGFVARFVSYGMMLFASLNIVLVIHLSNKHKYAHTALSRHNRAIKAVLVCLMLCCCLAILVLVAVMTHSFKLDIHVFDCLLLPLYTVFIIYLFGYIMS